MGEIIEFPRSDEQYWKEVEALFRRHLAGRGVTLEAIDWICADVKPRVMPGNVRLDLREEIPGCCEALVSEVTASCLDTLHGAMIAMFGNMLDLELKLYRATHLA